MKHFTLILLALVLAVSLPAQIRSQLKRQLQTMISKAKKDPTAMFEAAGFAKEHNFYIAAFNHLTPFPGTPLYKRLEADRRLLYDAWWLDPGYGYNQIPFQPKLLSPEELQALCLEARAKFYSIPDMVRRFCDPLNRSNAFMARNFPFINFMLRKEVFQRDRLPLGDAGWRGELIPVDGYEQPLTIRRRAIAV